MMPFAMNEATRFISPTKTPEYLSAGLPVVSTPIHDVVRSYGQLGMARIAATPDEFIAASEQAMAGGMCLKWRERADEYLRGLSWDSVWGGMNELIDGLSAPVKRIPATPAKTMTAFFQTGGFRQCLITLSSEPVFSGAVVASQMARNFGKKVMLIDRRNHVGGNAYDHYDSAGVLVHKYGPHIFHTNSKDVFDYLSLFTEWRNYEHRVLASVDGQFGSDSDQSRYCKRFARATSSKRMNWNLIWNRLPRSPNSSELPKDVVLSRVGRDLYEKMFRGYTRKQWGTRPPRSSTPV